MQGSDFRWFRLRPSLGVSLIIVCALCTSAGYGCGGGGGDSEGRSRNAWQVVEIYDTTTGEWSTGVPLPTGLLTVRSAAQGRVLWVTNGGTLFRFLPVQNMWETLPPVPSLQQDCDIAVVGGNVYILGGRGPSGTQVRVFDSAAMTWANGPPMTDSHHDFAAVELAGVIYVMGGPTTAVEALDNGSPAWRTLSPMPAAKEGLAAETDGTLIYVIGGYGTGVPGDEVHTYDPALYIWSPLAPMPSVGYYVNSGIIGQTIYAFGWIGPGNGRQVSTFDIATGTWDLLPPMKHRRMANLPQDVGVVAAGSLLYVIAGN